MTLSAWHFVCNMLQAVDIDAKKNVGCSKVYDHKELAGAGPIWILLQGFVATYETHSPSFYFVAFPQCGPNCIMMCFKNWCAYYEYQMIYVCICWNSQIIGHIWGLFRGYFRWFDLEDVSDWASVKTLRTTTRCLHGGFDKISRWLLFKDIFAFMLPPNNPQKTFTSRRFFCGLLQALRSSPQVCHELPSQTA